MHKRWRNGNDTRRRGCREARPDLRARRVRTKSTEPISEAQTDLSLHNLTCHPLQYRTCVSCSYLEGTGTFEVLRAKSSFIPNTTKSLAENEFMSSHFSSGVFSSSGYLMSSSERSYSSIVTSIQIHVNTHSRCPALASSMARGCPLLTFRIGFVPRVRGTHHSARVSGFCTVWYLETWHYGLVVSRPDVLQIRGWLHIMLYIMLHGRKSEENDDDTNFSVRNDAFAELPRYLHTVYTQYPLTLIASVQ